MASRRTALRFAAYGAIYFFWGASFLAIREIVAIAPPFFAAGFRFTLAGLILFTWTRMRGAPKPSRAQWLSSAALGLIMFTINYACLFWAEQRVASGYAAIIAATNPMWIFLGEWLILRALTPQPAAIAGVVLGLIGTVIVVWPGPGAEALNPAGFSLSRTTAVPVTAWALALVLGAVCWSSGALWSRKLDIPKSPLESAGMQMGLGGVMLLVFSAIAGEYGQIGGAVAAWNPRLTFDMAYLVCCASIAAFTAFLYLMNREPATRVASCSYVNPLVAVFLGATIAGERLTPAEIAGAALVICGVFFILRGKMPMRAASEMKLAAAERDI